MVGGGGSFWILDFPFCFCTGDSVGFVDSLLEKDIDWVIVEMSTSWSKYFSESDISSSPSSENVGIWGFEFPSGNSVKGNDGSMGDNEQVILVSVMVSVGSSSEVEIGSWEALVGCAEGSVGPITTTFLVLFPFLKT